MALVEHLHHAQVHLATLEAIAEQCVEVEIHIGHGREQCLLDEGRDRVVRLAQSARMVSIGRHPLESIEQGLLQGLDVLVLAAGAGRGDTGGFAVGLFALVAIHERAR